MIYAIILFVVLLIIYIGSFLLNKRTPRPKDCPDFKACHGCANMLCTHRKKESQ